MRMTRSRRGTTKTSLPSAPGHVPLRCAPPLPNLNPSSTQYPGSSHLASRRIRERGGGREKSTNTFINPQGERHESRLLDGNHARGGGEGLSHLFLATGPRLPTRNPQQQLAQLTSSLPCLYLCVEHEEAPWRRGGPGLILTTS